MAYAMPSAATSSIVIPSPTVTLSHYVNPALVGVIVFGVLFLLWSIYTLMASYHWLRYGHRSALAIPAITLHFFVSLLLAGLILSGI